MPIERRRTQKLHLAGDEKSLQRSHSGMARLEYERLMAEAQQAFDRITTQHSMARNARTARGSVKPV